MSCFTAHTTLHNVCRVCTGLSTLYTPYFYLQVGVYHVVPALVHVARLHAPNG